MVERFCRKARFIRARRRSRPRCTADQARRKASRTGRRGRGFLGAWRHEPAYGYAGREAKITGERTTEGGDETNNAQRDRCEIIARKGTGAENCAGASRREGRDQGGNAKEMRSSFGATPAGLHLPFNRLKVAIVGALSFTAGVAILETMTKLVEKTKARMFEDSGHCLTEPT